MAVQFFVNDPNIELNESPCSRSRAATCVHGRAAIVPES
jgi:hypothetical protein